LAAQVGRAVLCPPHEFT